MANEFKRDICFTFFEGYLKSADKIAEQFGKDVAYEYLTGIARYALYQEEPYDDRIYAMTSHLFYSIDKRQKRREEWFNRDCDSMEEVILKYNMKYPEIIKR